jgi:hypothetical protein
VLKLRRRCGGTFSWISFRPMDTFEQHVRTGLELQGIAVDDVDIAIMRAADAVYGPGFKALAEADLAHVWIEPDLDAGRAPKGTR